MPRKSLSHATISFQSGVHFRSSYFLSMTRTFTISALPTFFGIAGASYEHPPSARELRALGLRQRGSAFKEDVVDGVGWGWLT